MIAFMPPLWAILFLILVVGAAALYVVVVGLLWIWGRREEPAAQGPPLSFAALQDKLNRGWEARREFEAQFGRRIFIPFEDPVTAVYRQMTSRVGPTPPSRPYDWAHRERALAPDHYITSRGLLLGTTKWPPRG